MSCKKMNESWDLIISSDKLEACWLCYDSDPDFLETRALQYESVHIISLTIVNKNRRHIYLHLHKRRKQRPNDLISRLISYILSS